MDNRKYNATADVCAIGALPIAPPKVKYFSYACTSAGASAQTYEIAATGVATEGMGGFVLKIDQTNTKKTTGVGAGWTVPATNCWVQKKGGYMLTRRPGAFAGFTLIELMIALAVLGIVMAIGLPNVSVWIQNTQLKTAAEGDGERPAAGARRGAAAQCQRALPAGQYGGPTAARWSDNGPDWVVSLADPSGACGAAASDVAAPFIVQKKSGAEGSPNATVAGIAGGGTTAVFNGLGRLTGVGILRRSTSATRPVARARRRGGGPMRCLSILIGTGGQVRMCDPAVPAAVPPAADDPRSCGAGFAFAP